MSFLFQYFTKPIKGILEEKRREGRTRTPIFQRLGHVFFNTCPFCILTHKQNPQERHIMIPKNLQNKITLKLNS